ncbi:helix-turn-helix domain-containing protein [Chryseobacterium ginsenosidimutans]|uniref:helix-turn-helix domain-containing protein n=1 Tax=Chryseobacterium ginsenosidimutans TaxID=687846 RepID=UPI003593ABB7
MLCCYFFSNKSFTFYTNLTQQQFAKKAGVALSVVRKIEQEKNLINESKCKFYEIDFFLE